MTPESPGFSRGEYVKPREDELMRAIMNGATTYPEMMSALKVANRTINTMLCSMHAKTGSNNLADLILWRIKQGTD